MPDFRILKFPERPATAAEGPIPNLAVVELLEEQLVRAKAGELQGVLFAYVVSDGGIGYRFEVVEGMHVHGLAAVARLSHAVNKWFHEED